MDILSRNISKRGLDVIDDWLKNEGYFRKNAPHDAACLFRAVSEQIYLTQYYHLRVRKECVDYMRKNKQQFQKDVKGCIDDYLDRLSCVTEWAGFTEIRAMAQLYKCQFIMFDAKQRSIYPATDGDSEKKINLCQINQNVYEGVFQKELIATAAFCQSLIYQTLYKNVFEIPEADEIAKRMLRDRPFNIKFDKSFSKNNFGQGESSNQDQSENLDTDDVIDPSPNMKLEKAPFPLRIAKALDPNIYRNTEFDTWHELRKEVKYSGWTNWNNSELQIGAKCLVQLDYDKENIEDVNDDKEQLDHNDNVAPEKSKKVLIGHIQEMTKGEGPVVVFIEELGEKRTVPFKALKPLLASRRPQVPLGVIIPRRNLSLDQVTKWRIRSNPSPKKLKDTDCNSSTANVDIMKNNNKHNSHYNVKKLDKRTNWAEKNNVAVSPETILKPLTAIENYSVNNNSNFIEVRPVSVIMDNPPPLSNPGNEQKEEKIKTLNNNNTTTPTNNNSNNNNNNPTVVNNSINPMNGYEKLQVQGADGNATPGVNQVPINNQPSPIPLQHDPYFNQSPGPMYAPNPGVICLPSEGALYPMPYYTGQGEMQSAGGQESHLRAINITSPLSNDINGSDLPYSDPATLRFFYNLGVETFRCGQMWQPRGLFTYGPPHMPQGAVVPMMSPALPTDPPPNFQTSPHNDEKSGQNNSAQNNSGQNNARQNFQQNRRRNDQSNTGRNPGMNPDNRGNQRNFPRKDSRENFTRNESNPQDYQKNRPGFGANDKDGNRDQKKNNSRFKKTNDGSRPRNFERGQLQQEYQKPRDNLQGHNYKPNENNGFQRGNNNDNLLQPLPQFGMQGSPSPSSGSNPPFQGNYGQQPVYNNVQYYQNDSENFYPPTPNYYPVPFVPPPQQPPPQEASEGNNNVPSYICSGPESFPPPGSPIYPHYVFPPPAMYPNPAPANTQEGWIPMPSNQGPFVPFQVPGNQPANVSRPPPTSS